MKLNSIFAAVVIGILIIAAKAISGYEVGDVVSDFKLKGTDGKEIALSDFKEAKGVIVVFDCNTCPYSKAYNDRIIALNKKYASAGFPLIAINANDPLKSPGDSFEKMISHAKKNHYDFPYLFDESQNIARNFGATNTPHVFVLKRTGAEFKVAYVGAIDNNVKDAEKADKKYVEQAVEALLNGKEVPTAKTKAIGCSIKWKDA
jgi:peroxiredoxin